MDTFQNLASHELVVVASQRFAQVVRSSFTQTLVGRGALVPVGEGFISQVQPGLKFGDKSPPGLKDLFVPVASTCALVSLFFVFRFELTF
jgi:hypothetical protein